MTRPAPMRRILVAEDDPDIRDILVLNLEAEGFLVAAADNGVEAWALAKVALPDVIVLDVMMPERDGLEVLADLKADPRTRHIPVVLVTAKATDREVWEGWQSGADYYVTKPFDIDQFLRLLDSLLNPRLPVA